MRIDKNKLLREIDKPIEITTESQRAFIETLLRSGIPDNITLITRMTLNIGWTVNTQCTVLQEIEKRSSVEYALTYNQVDKHIKRILLQYKIKRKQLNYKLPKA